MQITCKIKKVSSSNDRDFLKALNIYHKFTPARIRTDENQILQYASGKVKSAKRDMVFYTLYCNDTVIGYAEIGVLHTSKIFFIDYFVLDSEYKNNAYFYMCYNLVIDDLLIKYPTFKYIIVEFLNDNETHVSSFGKKCLSLENYKIINAKYKQPGLYENDSDSVVECQLLIKETSHTDDMLSLSRENFINVLKDIFYNHYAEWFSHFFGKESFEKYYQTLNQVLKSLENQVPETVSLKNYTYINCQYFNPQHCSFHENSRFIKPKKINKKIFFLLSCLVFFLAVGLSIGVYFLLAKVLNINTDIIAVLISILVGIFTIGGSFLSANKSNR